MCIYIYKTALEKYTHLYDNTQGTMKHKHFLHLMKTVKMFLVCCQNVKMFLVCCRIGEYISLERFCFVNLTSSCSLVPYIERGRERERITAAVAFLFLVFVLHNRMLLRASKNDSNSCTTTEIIIQASLLQSVAFCVSGLCAVLPLMSLYHC